MATVEYGLASDLQVHEDPQTGSISYTVVAYCRDLDPVSTGVPFGTAGEEMALIAQALTIVPGRGTGGPIDGTYLLHRTPIPELPCDCRVLLHFGIPVPGTPLPGDEHVVRISGGTVARQDLTEFDAANLALAYSSRTPIQVTWDSGASGAPGSVTATNTQGASVPIFIADSTIVYERLVDYDPSAESRTYAAKTNATTWKGLAAGTVLCLEITFESQDNGLTYLTRYGFSYNPEKWLQIARYIDPATGKPPKLTTAQLAGSNGVKQITVQGTAEFNDLGL